MNIFRVSLVTIGVAIATLMFSYVTFASQASAPVQQKAAVSSNFTWAENFYFTGK